jgi:uncharacterized metal-binding protein YceD (DUF177 family)
MDSRRAPAPEFSRPFEVDRLGADPVAVEIAARPDELAALARRLGLPGLARLEARLAVRRRAGGMVLVEGGLSADAVQACVVTLDPVPARVEHRLAALFAPPELLGDVADVDPDAEEDPPEAIEDGRIDLGELAAQHLSLALDPYPRAPGAALDPALSAPDPDEPEEEERRDTPFAALARLRPPR